MYSEEIIKKLINATNVCFDCGKKYGNTTDKPIGVRTAECDICGKRDTCAAPRDFDYFYKTMTLDGLKAGENYYLSIPYEEPKTYNIQDLIDKIDEIENKIEELERMQNIILDILGDHTDDIGELMDDVDDIYDNIYDDEDGEQCHCESCSRNRH